MFSEVLICDSIYDSLWFAAGRDRDNGVRGYNKSTFSNPQPSWGRIGKLAAEYIADIDAMSNGEIQVEMFYSSSVVKSVET